MLPVVLAGPIVRRVEPRLCTFWIALSDPAAAVTATIWRDIQVAGATAGTVASGNARVASATVPTRRFGKRLNVALITIKIDAAAPALAPGTIYAYDIQIGDKGLRQLGLLKDEEAKDVPDIATSHRPLGLALGYVENRLPSFVTPPPLIEQTRFAHCSCRNSVGPAYDALAWLDNVIEDRLVVPAERPQQLFMTGDQIYADDLSSALLPMLTGLAHEVIGPNELLHVVATAPSGTKIDDWFACILANFPPLRRHQVVVQLAGYTTSDGESHLLSYGEYIALYLAAWSPRVWSALATAEQVYTVGPPVGFPLTPFYDRPENAEKFKGVVENWRDDPDEAAAFKRKTASTELYRLGVPHVARALANVATYMIFDDHDVTDDWNLNKKWVNRVYSKPFGRQIVRNAIMAYGVCQGWGNDPVAFETGKNKEFLGEIEKFYGDDNGPYPRNATGIDDKPGVTDRIDTLAGVSGAAFTEQVVWNYIVPAPKMQVVVLDTRTRRKFTGEGYLSPDLVGLNRDAQIPAGPVTDGRELAFVISAAPVLGPDIIDRFAWPLAQIAKDTVQFGKGLDAGRAQTAEVGVEKYDAEGWSSNDLAREDLLKRLATYTAVVLLGGDVHFACSVALDYYKKGVAKPSRIVQLTSSPARNTFKPVVKLLLRQNPFFQVIETDFKIERLAWTGPSPMVVPTGQFISPGRRSRPRRSPPLLPADLWPPGTSIPADKPPDWSWRLRVQRDVRHDTDLPTTLRQQLFTAADELNEANALPAYRAVATRHQTAAITRFEFLRQMVFQSNIGVVSLAKAGTDLVLTHTLLSQNAPDSVTSAENTVHVIPLKASAEAAPTVGFR